MECINEAMALKSSFLSGVAMKTHQVFHDEFWVATAGIYGGVGGGGGVSDDFSVDDLLDLSDKDFVKAGCSNSSVSPSDECVEFSEEDEEKDFLSVSSSQDTLSNFSGQTSFTSLPAAGELPVPVDDIENLEWLSKIVDDSTSEVSLLCPAEKNMKFPVTRFEPVSRPVPVQEFSVLGFSKPVPRKIRSKRFKPTGKAWPIGSFSLTESSSTSSSSIDSSVTSETRFSYPTSVLDSMVFFGKPPAKKQRKNPSPETGSGSMGLQPARRCTHCQVQKTPQWRTGPLGPKTLCNACGVRFKSGRLFPEYRPACSPTFSGDVHSNSHRKVLEMRRKKESLEMVRPGSSLAVSSF